jgi:chromosome segregation ATPase
MTTTGEGLTFEKVWAAIQATNEQLKAVGEFIKTVDAQIKATDAQIKATGEQMKETDAKIKATDAQIKATSEQMKETDAKIKATDAQIKATSEQMKETDAQIKATDAQIKATDAQIKATGEQMKETDRRMKDTDKRLGSLTNRFGEMVEYMIVPKLEEKFKELGFEFEKTHRNSKIRDQEHGIAAEIDAFLENGDRAMVVEIKNKPSVDDIHDHLERMEKLRAYADFHADTRKYLGAIAGVIFGESEKIYALKKGFYVIEPSGDTFVIIEPSGNYHPHEW